MIDIFFSIWDAIIAISMWGTIITAIGIFLYKIYLVIKNKANVKDYFLIVVSALYIGIIVYFGIEEFQFFFTVIFLMFAIIVNQLEKLEERKAGKRWWEH